MDVQGSKRFRQPSLIKSTPPAGCAVKSSMRKSSPRNLFELSSTAKMQQDQSPSEETTQLRQERLARIKAQIDSGEYDTEDRFEAALVKLFSRFDCDLDYPEDASSD